MRCLVALPLAQACWQAFSLTSQEHVQCTCTSCPLKSEVMHTVWDVPIAPQPLQGVPVAHVVHPPQLLGVPGGYERPPDGHLLMSMGSSECIIPCSAGRVTEPAPMLTAEPEACRAWQDKQGSSTVK